MNVANLKEMAIRLRPRQFVVVALSVLILVYLYTRAPKKQIVSRGTNTTFDPLPFLVIAHDRAEALKLVLGQLHKMRDAEVASREVSARELYPIIVSIDSGHAATFAVARRMADHVVRARYNKDHTRNVRKHLRGYYYIASHYRCAFDAAFDLDKRFKELIVLEDDFVLSPDLLGYFQFLRPLLHMDPSIMTVSAWNDNGFARNVAQYAAYLVHRTDFFPGLGWIMTRKLWQELRPKWPQAYWDDWLRDKEQRKNRSCIRPELSRVAMSTWASSGVSRGQFFSDHIGKVKALPEFRLGWEALYSEGTLRLLVKERYDRLLCEKIRHCSGQDKEKEFDSSVILWPGFEACEVKRYQNVVKLAHLLEDYNLMSDLRGGLFRTMYDGVIQGVRDGKRIFFVPEKYDCHQ